VTDAAAGAVVPTLVVSDLHLGANSGIDLLREDGVARRRLFHALDGVGRLVVAGDLLELRHAPPREILERARPFLRALGEHLGPERELLLLPGNHDHRLIRPWLEARRLQGRPLPLSTTLDPLEASPLAATLADAQAPG
jgi:metallophosphoesterase superfamily enzyme